MFSLKVIKDLLRTSVRQRRELGEILSMLPSTRCERRTLCCSMLPEMSLVEALSAVSGIAGMHEDMRIELLGRIIYYFFVNPVEIIKCPFLDDRECLIYQKRFFGCRAYGLWSKDCYTQISERSRQGKLFIRKQWQTLGISLPEKVAGFEVPYCSDVKSEGSPDINDEVLITYAQKIEELSGHFSDWNQMFCRMYFNDLGFLLASLIFGVKESVSLKFAIVSDIVKTGKRSRLEAAIENVPDIFKEIA